MFSEILKIIPRLDGSDLNNLEKSLGGRFNKIAKKFGKGLGAALTGGGIAGLALGLVDKLLNPLKDVQEAIDRSLKDSDDIATNAKQFNTSSGRLAKLVALGKATGLDPDALYTLMSKFQNTVAEAKKDPEKNTSVRQFVGMEDTAEAFYKFIQGLQKLDQTNKNAALTVQQEVFGEKQILKMADFLQSAGPELLSKIRAPDTGTLTRSVDNQANLNDLSDLFGSRRFLNDLVKKGETITPDMITARDAQLKRDAAVENNRIANYQSLMALSQVVDKTLATIEKSLLPLLRDIVPALKGLSGLVDKIPQFRGLRGIMKPKGE